MSPPIAVVLTVLTAMIMFGALGVDPAKAIETFFIEPVSHSTALGLIKATPLVLIGVGCRLASRRTSGTSARKVLVIKALAGGGWR